MGISQEQGNLTFHEVGMIAAIMADDLLGKLYEVKQENGQGYIDTVDTISNWALEFAEKHKETNWEKVIEKGITPLSKETRKIICWDDAVVDYGQYKLEEYLKSI